MTTLGKDEILKAKDMKTMVVSVPEWGGHVTIRVMSSTDRDAFESSILVDGKVQTRNIRAKLCALVLVDGEGKRLFTDQDIASLGKKSSAALDRVFSAAQKLNRLTADDVDELVKNSESGLANSSPST